MEECDMKEHCLAILWIVGILFMAGCSGGSDGGAPVETGGGLDFSPDSGIRIESGGVPSAGIDSNGTVYLYYHDQGEKSSTSTDGLQFSDGVLADGAFPYDPRAVSLAGGIWRKYYFPENQGVVVSDVSTDGIHFTTEEGARYAPQEIDNGWIGIIEAFTDTHGGVVMIYLGDKFGLNNARKAYSSDNGETFQFVSDNVLGDEDAGGGNNSYVDQRSIALPDGSRRLYVMKGGSIYSFKTDADGETFTLEDGLRLAPEDYTELDVTSLHDPTVILLPNGNYRMYVGAFITDTGETESREVILSATSPSD